MINNEDKQKKEQEILEIFNSITLADKESPEYKLLFQKIYTPIWDWTLMCFNEKDVRKAGVEIFHCIKRTLLKYEEGNDSSYIGYLYSCLRTEIQHKKEKDEVTKFRTCTKNEYHRAVELIDSASRIGKNPLNKDVQNWLAKQAHLTVEEVDDLVQKYYQSQIIREHLKDNEEGEETSIFETEAVDNNYQIPEQEFFRTENALEWLGAAEQVYDEFQDRKKKYFSPCITLYLLKVLERKLLIEQIVELLKNRSFLDIDILKMFLSNEELPTQVELAAKYGKTDDYVSGQIGDFKQNVEEKIST